MTGKIIKGIAGFYYVHTAGADVYECKAKGIFRNQKIKPLVGDDVELEILDAEKKLASIVDILPRKSELIRPAVANADQALVVFAAKDPETNFSLLDRFLILMTKQKLPVIICFNKTDLISEEECKKIENGYRNSGYEIRFLSAKGKKGTEKIAKLLEHKTTVLAGPSGVGKSTLVNLLQAGVTMETGEVSEKIRRGKHTTRHSEFIWINDDTYILDTPGFSSLELEDMEADELKYYFPEFHPHEGNCRFRGCIHQNEPDCAVKQAGKAGLVSKQRYLSYLQLYKELKEKEKYRY
ncbi:MAG: ribosome small subunit-dependent GTPase A [Lachnospiraceae bacterium]|nr:ribosome small subunit-dependent GTPase A [Lachnospiraceae bacterium]MBP3567869.1 ribosome small subunit-dependent GTPase A [Lachnospiraceae bacterium]